MSTPTPEQPAPEADAQQAPGQAPAADDPAARLAALEKELAEARKEAAKYRTTLRSQEQAAAGAEQQRLKEQGEFKALYEKEQAARAALEAEVAEATRKQQQIDAAAAAGLPLDMASRLVGATPEELLADAKALAERFKPQPPATGATNPAARRDDPPAKLDPKNPPRLSSIEWKQ